MATARLLTALAVVLALAACSPGDSAAEARAASHGAARLYGACLGLQVSIASSRGQVVLLGAPAAVRVKVGDVLAVSSRGPCASLVSVAPAAALGVERAGPRRFRAVRAGAGVVQVYRPACGAGAWARSTPCRGQQVPLGAFAVVVEEG